MKVLILCHDVGLCKQDGLLNYKYKETIKAVEDAYIQKKEEQKEEPKEKKEEFTYDTLDVHPLLSFDRPEYKMRDSEIHPNHYNEDMFKLASERLNKI